jgi:hypothetical protein
LGARLFATAFLCLAALSAAAESVVVEIDADNRVLSLPLPESAFSREGTQLAVDLDGYDVTSFGRIDDGWLFVDLEVALAAGEHTLALLAFHTDGSNEVLVDTTLKVAASAHREWALNTLFESNYRAGESSGADYAGVDPFANSGSVSLSASDTRGNWGSGAAVEAVYDENNGSVAGSADWLLPAYELYTGYGGETASGWAVAGTIGVERDDLLFSSYQRRGAAFEAAAATGRLRIKGFSVNSRPRSGFDGDYVIASDDDDRTTGLSTSLAIVDKRLEFGGGYVDGKSRFGGDGFNPQAGTAVFGGDSWNLALDSRWLADGLWVHLERAGSDFDPDGLGIGLPAAGGDAVKAQVQVESGERIGAGPFAYWSATLQYSEVGRDFYSLGNLALPGNLEVASAVFQGGFTSVVVDVEIARETTNPEDDPSTATQTLRRSGVNVAWSPATLNPDSGLFSLLGAPSVSAWLYRIHNSQPDSDAPLVGFDVDNETDEAGIALAFSRDELNWSIEYGAIDYDDRSMAVFDNGFLVYQPYSDSRNRYLSVAVGWVPGERLGLEAFLQRNALEETDYGDEYRSTGYGLSGNFVIVPDRLDVFASLTRGEDRTVFGDSLFAPERFQSDVASLQLNWQAARAEGAQPAINLFLKGNFGRNEYPGMPAGDDFWAVYLGASLNWVGSN